MVETKGREEKQVAENSKRCEKAGEAKALFIEEEKQLLVSNHGH
jgi:hypothetical protein